MLGEFSRDYFFPFSIMIIVVELEASLNLSLTHMLFFDAFYISVSTLLCMHFFGASNGMTTEKLISLFLLLSRI